MYGASADPLAGRGIFQVTALAQIGHNPRRHLRGQLGSSSSHAEHCGTKSGTRRLSHIKRYLIVGLRDPEVPRLGPESPEMDRFTAPPFMESSSRLTASSTIQSIGVGTF
jgi:hypothetical protein